MVELPPGPIVWIGDMDDGRPEDTTGDKETFSRAAVVIVEEVVVLMPFTTRSGGGSPAPCLIILLWEGFKPLTTSLTARA